MAAPRAAVWDVVSDPSRYLHVMDAVTRWEVVGERDRGLGARYRTLMRVGSAEIAGAGLFGWVAEHVAAPTVRGNLRRSLAQLKRQVEHDELRRAAAGRRADRAVI